MSNEILECQGEWQSQFPFDTDWFNCVHVVSSSMLSQIPMTFQTKWCTEKNGWSWGTFTDRQLRITLFVMLFAWPSTFDQSLQVRWTLKTPIQDIKMKLVLGITPIDIYKTVPSGVERGLRLSHSPFPPPWDSKISLLMLVDLLMLIIGHFQEFLWKFFIRNHI